MQVYGAKADEFLSGALSQAVGADSDEFASATAAPHLRRRKSAVQVVKSRLQNSRFAYGCVNTWASNSSDCEAVEATSDLDGSCEFEEEINFGEPQKGALTSEQGSASAVEDTGNLFKEARKCERAADAQGSEVVVSKDEEAHHELTSQAPVA